MIKYQSAFHTIERLCEVLNVSRSDYYAWLKRKPSKRDQHNEALSADIVRIFDDSRKTYGVPRIQKALESEGKKHGKVRIFITNAIRTCRIN